MRYAGAGIIIALGLFVWHVRAPASVSALPPSEEAPLHQSEPETVRAPDVVSEIDDGTTAEPQPMVPMKASADPAWKRAIATVFWVGEGENDDNGHIHNRSSAWDVDWQQHYGGFDDPECRVGYLPCGFTPQENPFYIALPFNDLRDDGSHKVDSRIPRGLRRAWVSDLKDRWVAVRSGSIVCYAQWEDVGPFGEDDLAYVFGDAGAPANKRGVGAGIDLSPAVRDCLGVDGLSDVEWRHIEPAQIPEGPWNAIVTRAQR